ncbi:MAG: carbohydrate ABC transporter permease [Sphaerochaeta sp.]
MSVKETSKIFRTVNTILMLIVVVLTIYPFLYLLAISFSSSAAVLTGKVTIIPKEFTTLAYSEVLSTKQFWIGYRNTFFYTIMGVFVSVSLTVMCAYPLSKPYLVGRNGIMKYIVFTMFFSGGLIPFFLVIKSLNMINTVWAIIIPGACSAYNVILMRTFFMGFPRSLEEAAEMDGATPLTVMFKIYLPNSKAILSTIALFYAVWYWNDWFNALILLNDNDLQPVTMFLRNLLYGINMAGKSGGAVDGSAAATTISQTIQASATILVILPLLCVYPFVQKYFVSGVMIGSVKG